MDRRRWRVIVECPSCQTRYRTDVAGAVDETTFFECTQADCGHVFQAAQPAVQVDELSEQNVAPDNTPPPEATLEQDPGVTTASPSVPIETPTPSAPLPDDEPLAEQNQPPESEQLEPPEQLEQPETAPGDDWSSGPPLPHAPGEANESDDFAPDVGEKTTGGFDQGPQPELDTFASAETPFFNEDNTEAARIEVSPLPAPTPRETVLSLKLLVLVLGLIVAGYASFTFVASSYLEETAAVLSKIPVLGPLLDAERPSAGHIVLTKMRGGFWHTKDGQQIFAIAGRATNQASVPAQSIQVEGTLLSVSGKVLGRRLIFCGTETAPEVLESLTRREVSILQSLMPPKQFRVPAGEGVDFLITFTEPPDQVVEFSSRVVAAQFGRSY